MFVIDRKTMTLIAKDEVPPERREAARDQALRWQAKKTIDDYLAQKRAAAEVSVSELD